MYLNNKKIVITGATSGIGKELMKLLLKEKNNKIIAVGRNIEYIEKNSNIIPYECDVSKKENVDKMIEFIYSKYEKIDIFFANAGYAKYGSFYKADWNKIENMFSVNVFSPIYTLEKIKEKQKKIFIHYVVTASAVSFLTLPGFALYCSTKNALNTYFEAYKFEKDKNIKLSLVYPVATKTLFFKRAGNQIPIPFPLDSAEKVASAILREIEIGVEKIFPNKLFLIFCIINRFLPFIGYLYQKIERFRFNLWRGRNEKIDT
jgi:short-subunit dehydrogenase